MNRAQISVDQRGRRTLDVSGLPETAWDSHAPVWWGNLQLTLIESTTLVLLLVSYFYLRQNFTEWPPPQALTEHPIFKPVPDLLIGTIETAILALSCIPMYLIDMAARRKNSGAVRLGLWLMFAVTVAVIVLRFFEFPHLKFRWDSNAYASICWTLLGTHLTYLLAAAAEFFIMGLYVLTHPLDEKHALDVTLAGGYWYWVAGTWVVVWAVVYFGARVL